ncbi:MAG: protein kinase, partial [Bryobacteraceae bacterium]|nr:protein kinase [Bryobacteraceae bacterium]
MSDVPSNSEETVLISASQDRVSSGPVETPLIWGHLTILEQVGAGGFGVVYRAWDPTLEREVALKLLNRKFSENVCLKEEGRLLARLRHPNVVTVYGCDTYGGRTGLWQEFIHGRTLSHVIAKHGSFGAREAVTVGSEVCLALAAVHKAGLVHRDVKA